MRILKDYEGRAIRLTDERLAHILEYPEMQAMERPIEETLLRPERVLQSLSDPQARLYYRMYLGTQVADNDAFVLTAYLVRKPVGGRQLWPKRN